MAGKQSIEIIRELALGEQKAAATEGRKPIMTALNNAAFSLLPQDSILLGTSPVIYQRESVTSYSGEQDYRLTKLSGGPIVTGRFGGMQTDIVETDYRGSTECQIYKIGFLVFETNDPTLSHIVPADTADVKDVVAELGNDPFVVAVDELVAGGFVGVEDIENLAQDFRYDEDLTLLRGAYLKTMIKPSDYISRLACRRYFDAGYDFGNDDEVRFTPVPYDEGVAFPITNRDSFELLRTAEGSHMPVIQKVYNDRIIALPLFNEDVMGFDLLP